MRVSNVDAGRRSQSARRSTGASAGNSRFADHLQCSAAEAGADVERPMVFAVGSVLPAQEVASAGDESSRARTQRYGEDILERLDELHLAILTGSVPAERVVRLAQMLRANRRLTDDPRLRSIVEEIELRAEVEIAKLTRTG